MNDDNIPFLTHLDVVTEFEESEADDLQDHLDEWGSDSATNAHTFDIHHVTLVDEDGKEIKFKKLYKKQTNSYECDGKTYPMYTYYLVVA